MNACYKIISKAYKQSNLQKNIHDQGEKKGFPITQALKHTNKKVRVLGRVWRNRHSHKLAGVGSIIISINFMGNQKYVLKA